MEWWIKDIIGYENDGYGYLNITIGLVTSKSAILWRNFGEEIFFRIFGVLLYVGMTPQTVIGLHSVWVRDMSGTRRFWIGNVSADSTQFGVMSDLIRSWIGVRSADIWRIHNQSKTDKPSTIGGWIKTDTSPNAPPQNWHHTNILLTDNRHFVRERSFKHVWKISPRQICLPEHKPTPNRQNRINTDCKPTSPRI